MKRGTVSIAIVGVLALGVTACGDRAAEPTVADVDFSPSATISVSRSGIDCLVDDDADACEVSTGSVVTVGNADDVDHRLIGTSESGANVFDTGAMQPGDEMTLVLVTAGTITVTDPLWSDGESPTLDITVLQSPS